MHQTRGDSYVLLVCKCCQRRSQQLLDAARSSAGGRGVSAACAGSMCVCAMIPQRSPRLVIMRNSSSVSIEAGGLLQTGLSMASDTDDERTIFVAARQRFASVPLER